MKRKRYRIIYKEHYVFVEHGGRDYMYKIIRPEIQIRVFKFFWLTIKKFICNNEQIADISANTLLKELNKKYRYE